jgi:signal transduction histidine kinase
VSDGGIPPGRSMLAVHLEQALAISGAATWEWNVKAHTLRYSPNLPHVWRLDPAIFARSDLLALSKYLHPGDRRAYIKAHRALHGGVRMDVVYRARSETGDYRWYREIGQTGEGPLRIGTVVDVTDLKDAEALIADGLDSLSDGFCLYDAADRLVVHNRRFVELFPHLAPVLRHGVPFEDVTAHAARVLPQFKTDAEREAWRARRVARHRAPGETFVQGAHVGRVYHTTEFRTRGGGIATVVRDMTALSETQAHLSLALDVAELGWWTADLAEGVETWSARARRIWGIGEDAPAEFATLRARVHPDDLPGLTDIAAASKSRGVRAYRVVHRDGAVRHVREDFRVERDGKGRARRVFATLRDETETERARLAAEAANRAKSEFLAMVSHELRTPLNGVVGTLDLIEDSPLAPEQARWAAIARASAEALIAIVDDLLDLAKLEAGKLAMAHGDYDPVETVESAVDGLQARAAERGNALVFSPAPGLPPRVSGDRGRLRQIVVNLVGNAIKFTENGRVEVRFAAEREADGRWKLAGEVADTGIGMDAATLARLFAPFYQADTSTTRKSGGTGLGLAICKRLAAAMDGGVEATSAPGAGSVFRFWIRAGAA